MSKHIACGAGDEMQVHEFITRLPLVVPVDQDVNYRYKRRY